MHRFSLFTILDREMTRERIPSFRHPHLYPSEASVRDSDGVLHGACLRSVWYRLTSTPKTNPPDARAQWIFDLGIAVEELVIRRAKEAGIWFDDHVKWYNPEYNVSGELDLIIRHPEEPDMLCGCEIKSFYGYAATAEIMGNRTKPGFPKMSQLLQTFLYVDWFKEILSGFKMFYLNRGATENRREFNIEFREVNGGTGQEDVLVYPVVDGRVYPKFTLGGIYERYRKVWEYFTSRELPPRDYQLYYSKEEMAQRVKDGLASKADAAGFKKHPDRLKFRKADWQCLTKGTRIVTPLGLKPVEEIHPGEEIISGDGLPHKVTAKIISKPSKPVVKVKPYQLPAIELTEDHQVKVYPYRYSGSRALVSDQAEWIEAGKLKDGKYRMVFPFPTEETTNSLTDWAWQQQPELARLLGYFVAEGSYAHKGGKAGHFKLSFCINQKERWIADDLEEIARLFTNRFGKPANARRYPKQDPRNGNQYMNVTLYAKDAVAFVKRYVQGDCACNKRFAPEVLTWPRDLQRHLLDALLAGDGSEVMTRENLTKVYSTSSKELAYQVFIIMLRLGYLPGLVEQERTGSFGDSGKCYHVRYYVNKPGNNRRTCLVRGNEYLVSICKVEPVKYQGLVYDLSVEDLPEILTESGVVHNCRYCNYRNLCWEFSNLTSEQIKDLTGEELKEAA